MTTTYRIENTTSGHVLGYYDGESELGAYQAMMTDAGYPTEERAQSAGVSRDEIPADIRVTEIAPAVTADQIRALMTEAAAAGDAAQVEMCEDALADVDGGKARAECARVIADAAAQDVAEG